jgi:Sulfotransferase domain
MIREILYTLNYFLGRDIAGRSLHVLPDDIFLVSYPRSGNTWVRFLLGNLLNPDEQVTFNNLERKVPNIYGASKRTFKRMPRPRLIKSHECFDPRYRRVIYIVRDPRDVAVSAYHYGRKMRLIDYALPIEPFVTSHFMQTGQYFGTWEDHVGSWLVNPGNIFQISRIKDGFMGIPASWGENVTSWLGARGHDRKFLLLRYEDLLEDTEQELAKVSEFLALRASPERIARAVALSSAENMRKVEVNQSSEWQITKIGRKDIPFVRAAKSEQWKMSLPASAVAEIESAWGPVMQLLAYPLSTDLGETRKLPTESTLNLTTSGCGES